MLVSIKANCVRSDQPRFYYIFGSDRVPSANHLHLTYYPPLTVYWAWVEQDTRDENQELSAPDGSLYTSERVMAHAGPDISKEPVW